MSRDARSAATPLIGRICSIRPRGLHPYLFEHHPERNAWSFRKTLAGSLLPRRFWQVVHPSQPSHGRRLIAYWVLTTIIYVMAVLGSFFCVRLLEFRSRIALPGVRAAAANQWNSSEPWAIEGLARITAEYGSLDNWLDYWYPLHVTPHALWRYLADQPAWPLLYVLVPLWPILTFAALMVFQVSMRRKRLKPVHVLRCVVYSFGRSCCDRAACCSSNLQHSYHAAAWVEL